MRGLTKQYSKVGPLCSPMAKPMHGLIKKGSLSPAIAANTMRPGVSKKSAPVRSAHTGGAVVRF